MAGVGEMGWGPNNGLLVEFRLPQDDDVLTETLERLIDECKNVDGELGMQ